MRGILAMGVAVLLSVTAPVYAADLEMPVKAPPPPPVAPVEFDWWPLLLLIPIAVCIAECPSHHHKVTITQCASPGGCTSEVQNE